MRKYFYAIIVGIVLMFKVSNGQEITPVLLHHYEITMDVVSPIIRIFTGNNGSNYFDVPIDNSKVSEYVMAKLLLHRDSQKVQKLTVGGIDKFRFIRKNGISDPTCGDVDQHSGNLVAIGFYKEANAVVLEVFTGTISNYVKYEFVLPATASFEKKIQFDYIVSALNNYYACTGDHEGIQITTEVDGGRTVGKSIKFHCFVP